MPPFEDIAWKFVSRVDARKWRCPHCKTEYSGTVTRVKSHLLKIPGRGISLCAKVPDQISELMHWLLDEVRNKDDIAWKFVIRLGDNKWRCYYCSKESFGDLTGVKAHLLKVPNEGISICTEAPDSVKKLMLSLIDEVAEGESREVAEEQRREANGQSSMEPKSHDERTQAEVAEEESREANSQFSMEPESHVPLSSQSFEDMENLYSTTESDNLSISIPPLQKGELRDRSFTSLLEKRECQSHHSSTMSSFQSYHNSTMSSQAQNRHGKSSSTMASVEDKSVKPNLPYQPHQAQCSIGSPSAEETQMNDQQTPAGASAFQDDHLPDVDNSDCLQACNQHPQLQTPMDIDPSIASQHASDSHDVEATILDLLFPGAARNTTGPPSSQDMKRGSSILEMRSIYANNEGVRNLKRKVSKFDDPAAFIKEQMEKESAASSVQEKMSISVERSAKETERARNNFPMIGQASVETLPPKEPVETLRRDVEELIERRLPQKLLREARDAKGGPFLEQKLIGEAIRGTTKLIWNRLKENNVCKLGIHGMGGVGKTTLAMHIYNRLLEDATFDGVLFLNMSQDFSIYKLQNDIWKLLQFGVMEDEHEKKRAAILSVHLERMKNCVLIFDDVWQHFILQDVGIPNRAGLKVVLTTRFSEVCSRMDCEEIKIQPLDNQDAWKLFVEELGPKPLTNKPVVKVAREIVNRCRGLPLAISTMASSMRGKENFFVWKDALNKLERSIAKHAEMRYKVLPVLKLSYERLSDPQVKQCFLFCALFPENISIPQLQLIEYFIDEGFLDEADTREEQYYWGLTIVDMLRKACLLEVDDGRARMHDLIRQMALYIVGTAYMVKAGLGLRRIPDVDNWTKDLEKVSLMQGRIKGIPPDMSPNCPKLSTLLLNGSLRLKSIKIQDSFFMNMRALKVLNLSECYALTELPNSLSKLSNLKALLLRGCWSLHRIPYLGNLKFLRKLDANMCSSLIEVAGLEKLRNLRYLNLSGTGIKTLVEETLRGLVNLQYLKIARKVKVKAYEVIKLEALQRLECNFGDVDDFNKYVRIIKRRHCHNYSLIVDQGKKIWSVSAYVYSDPEIWPENKIKEDEDYHDYKSVEIKSCNYAMARGGEEMNNNSILIPEDVEFFKLRNWQCMTNLSGMGQLQRLKVLRIKKWDNSVLLFGGAEVDKAEVRNTSGSLACPFPSLEMLKITGCSKLKYLFGYESRFSLLKLREVSISQCEGIEGMTTSVTSLLQLEYPAFPRLERIILEDCGNMKRVMGFDWLPHFPNLTTIKVKNCNNIRELLPHEGFLRLPNLEHIEVRGCEGIEEIISGGGENHGGSASLNTCSSSLPFPFSPLKSKRLLLHDLPQLKSICEGTLGFIPITVEAHNCPKLTIPPQGCISSTISGCK